MASPGSTNWKSLLLVLALALQAVVLISCSPQASQEVEQSEIAEDLLGHWETVYQDQRIVLNLDGVRTNPVTGLEGNSIYNIRGNTLITGLRGRVVAYDIEFTSPDESVWTDVESGERHVFHRSEAATGGPGVFGRMGERFKMRVVLTQSQMRPVPPTSPELLEVMPGGWRSNNPDWPMTISIPDADSVYLHIDNPDTSNDITSSPFRLIGDRIDFNQNDRIRSFHMEPALGTTDRMIWRPTREEGVFIEMERIR